MKRMKYIVMAGVSVLCFLLTACGTGADGSVENIVEDTAIETPDAAVLLENVDEQEAASEEEDTAEELEEPPLPHYYMMENPSQEYYLTSALTTEDEISVTLEKLTEETNEITDTEAWFAANGLTQPFGNVMEDDNYRYELEGENGVSIYLLNIYDKESGNALYCLDFSDYRYTDNIKAGDEEFVEQRIWWAQSVDDVLYIAIGHYTYTESCPHTGYLIAIDLNDMSVIWKSEPCVTNAQTFEIIDNTIVCGYGFTSEPDYLILVDRLNGSVTEKIPIRSKADYIIRKEDVLYVRTYNTNYTFQIMQEVSCR
ncbi:MAG: hypothetical protein NC231_03390 [Bacillus sp. (in: Bacteria)]|nr:hypothetical protein [Bacillus sp. (in: firmicutes)]MCM1426114.1 hypothetical protein [Eubacterium sp.]